MRRDRMFFVATTIMFFVWIFGIFMLLANTLQAADAIFSWLPNSESDLAGYKIYYGPVSRQYETTIDTGLPDTVNGRVQYTITDVPESKSYFAATAYDTSGLESDYSTEVIYDPAPAAPGDFKAITVNVTVNIQ